MEKNKKLLAAILTNAHVFLQNRYLSVGKEIPNLELQEEVIDIYMRYYDSEPFESLFPKE